MKFAAAAAVLVASHQSMIALAQECSAQFQDGSCRPPQPECGVYMAPSTLGETTYVLLASLNSELVALKLYCDSRLTLCLSLSLSLLLAVTWVFTRAKTSRTAKR